MTFEAQLVDLIHLQQTRVIGAVGHMASRTAFGFHREVFEYERTLLLSVALVTDLILLSAGSQLLGQTPTRRVMTIFAIQQT